jgi:hypothetical protein
MHLLMIVKRMFRRLTVQEMAVRQLIDTEMELMDALAMREANQASIACYQARIARLKQYTVEHCSEVRAA